MRTVASAGVSGWWRWRRRYLEARVTIGQGGVSKMTLEWRLLASRTYGKAWHVPSGPGSDGWLLDERACQLG